MSKEAMKLALEALNVCEVDGYIPVRNTRDAIKALEKALAKQEQGEPEYRCCPHDHDCAVHNMPAYPAGPCDCTYKNTFNTPPSTDVHEVCLKLVKRELEKIEHKNFGRMPNDSWTNKVLNVYHFFDSNPKAKKLTVIYTTPQQRTWVGLTDDERRIIINDWQWQEGKPYHLCLSIEAKLKEKNT